MAEENIFPKEVQDAIKDLKKQGYSDQLTLKLINENENLQKKLVDSGKITKKTLQELVENNKNLKDLKNAIKETLNHEKGKQSNAQDGRRLDSVREMLLGDTKKGINDFVKTLNLGSTKVGKLFEDFKVKHAGIFAAIVDGYKIADKMMKSQATRNEALYAVKGENKGGFWNVDATQLVAATNASLLRYGYSKKESMQMLYDQGRMYNTRDMSNAQIANRAQMHGAWESFLGKQGVSADTSRSILEGLYKREGLTDTDINRRILDNFQKQMRKSGMSAENFAKAVLELEKRGRALGETFSSAASKVAKHGKAVESGTVSWENITTYRDKLVNADTGTLAGLATEMAYAGKLPSDMTNLIGQPLQLAGVMRARMTGAGGEKIARGLEEKVREEAKMQGFTQRESMGEYFRMRYGQMGFNLSKAQYEALGRGETLTTGKYGSLTSEEENQRTLDAAAQQAYQDTSSISENVGAILGVLQDLYTYNTQNAFKTGINKAIEKAGQKGYTSDLSDPNWAWQFPVFMGNALWETLKAQWTGLVGK